MDRTTRWIIGGAGALLAVLFAVLSRIDGLTSRIGLFLVLYAVSFAAYAASVVALGRAKSPGLRGRILPAYVLAVATICRALLLPAEPVMSTDVYRYLWEGRMITHGYNPFSLPPEAAELEPLRDEHYAPINHKHLKTIYPPVAQAVFAAAAWVRPDPQTQKLFFVLFDLGVIAVLMAFLRLRSADPLAAIIYAWNPLVIFETAHSGHTDAVGIFLLVLGLWLLARGQKLWGFVSLGLSMLAKYLAGVFLPYFALKKRYVVWVPVMLAVVIVGYLPFAGAGSGLFSSLEIYGTQWRFNGLIYKLLHSMVGDPLRTRWILTLLLGVAVVYQSFKQRDPLRFAFVVIATALLLAPTLYPWYVAWVVPFLCFYPNRAWILFTGLVMLSYWVWVVSAVGGEWELSWRLYAIEYVPFYALLLFDARRRRQETPS
jgi:alpha-1,6-mannosyltransferase